jgi:hypothetical protein
MVSADVLTPPEPAIKTVRVLSTGSGHLGEPQPFGGKRIGVGIRFANGGK